MERLCVYPKDVRKITGKSLRHAQNVLQTIRKEQNKKKHHAVTRKELADYLNMDEDDITLL